LIKLKNRPRPSNLDQTLTTVDVWVGKPLGSKSQQAQTAGDEGFLTQIPTVSSDDVTCELEDRDSPTTLYELEDPAGNHPRRCGLVGRGSDLFLSRTVPPPASHRASRSSSLVSVVVSSAWVSGSLCRLCRSSSVVGGRVLDEKDAHRSGWGLCLCWSPQSWSDLFSFFFCFLKSTGRIPLSFNK